MRHASLFTGIGGFDLASEWMEWKNVFQVENDSFCNKVLEKNFPNTKRHGDIREFNGAEYRGAIDVLSGGFPCQDISIANVTKGGAKGINGERSGLWKEYARVVREIEPRFIVFENSPMLVDRGFEQILCDLARMGYNAEWRSVFSTEFGFPDYRERIYGIAYSNSIGLPGDPGKYRILQNTLRTRKSGKIELPFPIERIKRTSDFGELRINNGVCKRLDKSRVKALGNSIKPQIAFEFFKAIQLCYTNS